MVVYDQMVHQVVALAGGLASNTLASTVLAAVGIRRDTLDVPALAQCHYHLLMRDQVFICEV